MAESVPTSEASALEFSETISKKYELRCKCCKYCENVRNDLQELALELKSAEEIIKLLRSDLDRYSTTHDINSVPSIMNSEEKRTQCLLQYDE
jgi:hypothetical protein